MIHIGVLGAAGITDTALLTPAHTVEGVAVTAMAARDPARAQAYATQHGISRVHTTYADLLADVDLDAVYIPLPVALHAEWTLAAMAAGKHVLCEKPFTANAVEAEHVAWVAAETHGLIIMEAYHTHYHPLIARLQDILHSGILGEVYAARARLYVPIPPGPDIRWNLALGGGGLLDVGYYPVRLLRELFGSAPTVVRAQAKEQDGIDRLLRATLQFDQGARGTVVSSIWSKRLEGADLEVRGSRARLRVNEPYRPQLGATIRVDGPGVRVRERVTRRSTYMYQLEAFRDAIVIGGPVATDPAEAIPQLQVIDQIYEAAGMCPRGAPPARRQQPDVQGGDSPIP